MNAAQHFMQQLKEAGFNFFTGVPCSFLTQIINQAISDPDLNYVPATSEGEALALAAGNWLAGGQAVVMCQNSGLGNMINPLTSLNVPFAIPALLIVTHRGKPGIKDEPQHQLMGEITLPLLALLGIPALVLPASPDGMAQMVRDAVRQVREQQTVALIVEKGIFSEEAPSAHVTSLPARAEVLQYLSDMTDEQDVLIATTGKTGRELFTLRDRAANLYCVGSMGYASALAQGLALGVPKRSVTIIDGDGAALMHPGNMATIGYLHSPNLIHVILDNGTYDSTGGQSTLADGVDFCTVAKGMGYRAAHHCLSLPALAEAWQMAKQQGNGPVLLTIKISGGSLDNLGRPSVTPEQIARRLQRLIKETSSL